jgi:hypothetical protein
MAHQHRRRDRPHLLTEDVEWMGAANAGRKVVELRTM